MKEYEANPFVLEMAKATAPSLRWDPATDYAAWSRAAREKLRALLCLSFERCADEFQIVERIQKEGFEQIRFEFQSEPGYYVKGCFLLPAQPIRKRPAVICLQGHSTGMHISLGVAGFPGDEELIAGGRDFAVQAVKQGYCAVVIDQRYMGRTGQTETGAPECAKTFRAMNALLMGRCAIGERVWDVQRLIDVIEKYFPEYADTERLICMGNSGGGTTTFYASALDERIRVSIPSCAVCTYEDSIMAMAHCRCNYIPGIRKYFNMGDIGMLIAPRRLIVVCGREDPIFPLPGVLKSVEQIKTGFRATGSEQNFELVIGEGGHRFYPDQVWPIVHAMIDGEGE